jgi:TalC/MipB family fructose-6-phosphate aldolase
MKLFLDTGNIKDIETLATIGIIDGVTTNPSLLAKEPGDYRENLKKICAIVQGPVSGEVIATDYAGMIREGHEIAAIDEFMVVKLPLTRDGIRACKTLSGEGIKVNVTLVFSAAQALLAAKAGATFVSPFVATSSRYTTTTSSPPRCSWPAAATRSTSSTRRAWARTSARAHLLSSISSSTTRSPASASSGS